jgi:hypothetical protein
MHTKVALVERMLRLGGECSKPAEPGIRLCRHLFIMRVNPSRPWPGAHGVGEIYNARMGWDEGERWSRHWCQGGVYREGFMYLVANQRTHDNPFRGQGRHRIKISQSGGQKLPNPRFSGPGIQRYYHGSSNRVMSRELPCRQSLVRTHISSCKCPRCKCAVNLLAQILYHFDQRFR